MTRIITSQHYLNDETVARKVASRDFVVALSPAFKIDGDSYQVVLDGHHSLAAALESGADPEYVEYDQSNDDRINLIGNPEQFLEAVYMDGEYIDAISRTTVW